jgi:hypothetical protein
MYLIAGEEDPLLVEFFPRQPDARRILARARMAVGLIAGGKEGPEVLTRLQRLDDALSLQRPRREPPMPAAAAPADWEMPTLARSLYDAPPLGRSAEYAFVRRPPSAEGIEAAVRLGAYQVDRLRALLYDGTSIRPLAAEAFDLKDSRQASDEEGVAPAPLAGIPSLALAAAAIASPLDEADIMSYQVPAPGGTMLSIWVERGTQEQLLKLSCTGAAGARDAIEVLWLPEVGNPMRATIDDDRIASLALPAAGKGVIRIDAARTLEIEFHIRM